jgi:hypothetical protein
VYVLQQVPPSGCKASFETVQEYSTQIDTMSALSSTEFGGDVFGYFRHTITDCDSMVCVATTSADTPGVFEVSHL